MRKSLAILLLFVFTFSLSACSFDITFTNESTTASNTDATEPTTESSDSAEPTTEVTDTTEPTNLPDGFQVNDMGLWYYPEYDAVDETEDIFLRKLDEDEFNNIMDNFIEIVVPDEALILQQSCFNQKDCSVTFEYDGWEVNVSYVFRGTDNDTSTCLMEYLGTATELTVPTVIGELPVNSLLHDALASNDTVKEFIIPDNDFHEFGITCNESVEIVRIGKCNNAKPDCQYFSYPHTTLVYMNEDEAYYYLGQVVEIIAPGNVCVTLNNGDTAWHCLCEYGQKDWGEWPYIKTYFDQCYHPEHDVHIQFNNDTQELETF